MMKAHKVYPTWVLLRPEDVSDRVIMANSSKSVPPFYEDLVTQDEQNSLDLYGATREDASIILDRKGFGFTDSDLIYHERRSRRYSSRDKHVKFIKLAAGAAVTAGIIGAIAWGSLADLCLTVFVMFLLGAVALIFTLPANPPMVTTASGKDTRTFTAGRNRLIRKMMIAVHQQATGYEDPVWLIYESATELADERASTQDTTQRELYKRAIKEHAEQIQTVFEQREKKKMLQHQLEVEAVRQATLEVEEINRHHQVDPASMINQRLNERSDYIKNLAETMDEVDPA